MLHKITLALLLCGSKGILAADQKVTINKSVVMASVNIVSGVGMCVAALYGKTPLVIASGISLLLTARVCEIDAARNPSAITKNAYSEGSFVVVSGPEVVNNISTIFTFASMAATVGIYAGRQGYMPIARS